MFFEAGRAEIRDLLDAQSALLSARNSMTSAVINYRMAAARASGLWPATDCRGRPCTRGARCASPRGSPWWGTCRATSPSPCSVFLLSVAGSPLGSIGQSIMLGAAPERRERNLSLFTTLGAVGSLLAPAS